MKKIFTLLTLALMSIGSAWADGETWTVDYSTKTKSWTLDNNQETMDIDGYGTVTLDYNNDKGDMYGNAGYIKISGNAVKLTITLPDGKYFKAGDKIRVTGKGGKSGSPGCVYIADGVLKGPQIAKSSTSAFESDDLEFPSDFETTSQIVIRRATSNETGPDGETKCGGTFYVQKILYTEAVAATAPIITTQPASAEYGLNATAEALTVAATASDGDLSYQWYSNSAESTEGAQAIDGATTASYTPSTSTNGVTYYYCVVTDANGSTTSAIAAITVSAATAPTISVEASATLISCGGTLTLSATVDGFPAPTIQWYSNTVESTEGGVAIEGATSETCSPAITEAGKYYYYAIATNSEGAVPSEVIAITVVPVLSKVVFSNSFDAFVVQPNANGNGTVKAYYLAGTEEPTIVSNEVSDGATLSAEGTTITVSQNGVDAVFDVTVEAVTPYDGLGDYTFTAEDAFVKAPYGFGTDSGKEGWKFAKAVEEAANRRVSEGRSKIYLFLSPCSSVTLTSGSSADRNVDVLVNGEKVIASTKLAKNGGTLTFGGDPENAFMVAVVSAQTGGDGTIKTMNTANIETTVTTAGYATYVTPVDVDFAGTGVTAYTAKAAGSYVELNEVTAAPKGTALVIKADAGTSKLKAAVSPAAVGNNDLVAGGVTGDGASYYVLGQQGNTVGFGILKAGVTLAADKAYIPADKFAGEARTFYPFTGTTAIKAVEKAVENGQFFNLAGQRVAQPQKGLYIVNGKKVIVK